MLLPARLPIGTANSARNHTRLLQIGVILAAYVDTIFVRSTPMGLGNAKNYNEP